MNPDDERRVIVAVRESVPGRLVEFVAGMVPRIRMPGDASRAVRLAGCALTVASLTHAVLLRVWPPATVGRIPLATSVMCSVIGAVAVLAPQQIVAGWERSFLRRLLSER